MKYYLPTVVLLPLLMLMALLPLATKAQVNIDDYRQSVVDYSYTLKKAESQIAYTEQNYRAKESAALPALTLTGSFTQQLRKSEGQESWNFGLQPQLSYALYAGGLYKAETHKALLGYGIAQADASQALLELYYSADYNYYNLEAIGAYCLAIARYVEIITELREVVLLRYNEGYISKGDLLMIETRLNEALYEQVAMQEQYTIALQSFNILRGVDPDQDVELTKIEIDRVVLPARASFDELLMRRPDFLASTMVCGQAQSTVAITRAAYNPSLSVGVTGVWQPHSPNINGSTQLNGALFVSLSAPLFKFGERRRSVSAAESLHLSSELTTMALIDDIRLEESNMWAKVIDSRAKLDAARRALTIGDENLEISTFSYSEGLTTILDVMQAQISWLQLYGNSIWSEFNLLVSISAYERICGERGDF